jgi:diguanylate cyclase (GGDEF)-like protein/PAS domain S-box-containing protein
LSLDSATAVRDQPFFPDGGINRLLERQLDLQTILDNVKDAIVTVDAAGHIETFNPTGERIFGYSHFEVAGRSLEFLLPDLAAQGTAAVLERLAAKIDDTHVDLAAHQAWGLSKDGQRVAVEFAVSKAHLRRRDGYVVCIRDITERKKAETAVCQATERAQFTLQSISDAVITTDSSGRIDYMNPVAESLTGWEGREAQSRLIDEVLSENRALRYQACHDVLTGLINRREFENRLGTAVDSVREDARVQHSLLYLDLDQFKVVNDTCGHPAGDRLLKQITGVLQSRVRAGDTLARLGGDEFGILLQGCGFDQALRIAESLRRAIRDFRFNWREGVLAVGVSIGIVQITIDTPTVANLMSAADVACYSAKELGRNRSQVYQPDAVPERHREMHGVSQLTRACDEGRFELLYQPIVPIDPANPAREHFGLMLRMRDDAGALVTPAEFIPAAERYDAMAAIDRWVVRQAFDRVVHREGSGAKPYTVAVNLSGNSLNDEHFLEFLIAELSGRELCAGAICFEITESAAIANLGSVVHFMRELKARGCRFALDDFGSGLSSFMYLKTLPVDYLKIDAQFIANVVHDPVDRSMVEAISHVARAMGIETIAERVESAEVLAVLGGLGIGFAQGHHIAEPRSISGFPYRAAR